MEKKDRPLTPQQVKLCLLDALETLKETAYYEDGYSEEDEECYLLLKDFIERSKINRLS